MPSKFQKQVKRSMEQETGEKVSYAQVGHFVEQMCESFWATWEGAGAEEAVARQPDVAEYLMYRQPGGETRTRIGRLLCGEKEPAPQPPVVEEVEEAPVVEEQPKLTVAFHVKEIEEWIDESSEEHPDVDRDELTWDCVKAYCAAHISNKRTRTTVMRRFGVSA